MKHLALFLLAILQIFYTSAQKIHFTDTSNRWTLVSNSGGSGEAVYDTYEYKMGDDTTIGSQVYKKIAILSDKVSWDLFSSNHTGGFGKAYIGLFFREDTIANKVYCITVGDTMERLIYSSSWRVGDSVAWSSKLYSGYNKVTRRDSLFFNSAWHYIFEMRADWQDYWIIEGVGSDRGTAFPAYPITGEFGARLKCFKHGDAIPDFKLHLGYDNLKSCAAKLAINKPQTTLEPITITPNPGGKGMYVDIPSSMGDGVLQLADMTGKTILSMRFQAPGRLFPGQYLYTSGVYFYRIDGASGNSYRGLLVFQ